MSSKFTKIVCSTIGVFCLYATLSLLTITVVGCSQQNDEPRATELGDLSDTGGTTIRKIDLEDIGEVDLVEQLAAARADYKRLLKILRQWYLEQGYYQKSRWVVRELEDLVRVKTYSYLTISEIRMADLSASQSIAQADQMHEQALKLYQEGQIVPFLNDKQKLKESLAIFLQLIKKYPTSDKIDDAAFYAGEISKEYFNDDQQAVYYYELAMIWDPQTPHPVRFQAAVVYDFRLHDRAKALELYHRVLAEEPDLDKTNTGFATRRIKQILKEQEAQQQLESR